MRIRTITASAVLLALFTAGCSSSDTPEAAPAASTETSQAASQQEPSATDAPEQTGVDTQQLALGPGDLPDRFTPAAITDNPQDTSPPDCAKFDDAELSEPVGTNWQADDGFQSVEIRVGAGDHADRIMAAINEIANCPDTTYTDPNDGTEMNLVFDRVDTPAGAAATMTGTAGGFPFTSQFAAFETGGHTVALFVLGLGGLPDGVDLADLVQLTVDRANGDAPPAPDAPELAPPGQTPADDEGTSGDAQADTMGSRDQPLAVGETASVGDWQVTVDDIALDATDTVRSANQFNSEPEFGNYALITLTMTFRGEGDGDAGFAVSVGLSGQDKRQYRDSDCSASEPTPMFDQPTVENGGTVTGQFCLDYPDEAVGDDAALFVEETMSFDDTRTFWGIP